MYRCPTAIVGEASPVLRQQVDLLMRCYLQYDSRHVLPVDGGVIEQTRSFVSGCEIIDGERSRLEMMKQEKRERDQLAAQRKSTQASRGR